MVNGTSSRELRQQKSRPETRTAGAAVPPLLATASITHLDCQDNGRRPGRLSGKTVESRLRDDASRSIAASGFHHPGLAWAIGSAGVFPSLPLPFSTSQPTT